MLAGAAIVESGIEFDRHMMLISMKHGSTDGNYGAMCFEVFGLNTQGVGEPGERMVCNDNP